MRVVGTKGFSQIQFNQHMFQENQKNHLVVYLIGNNLINLDSIMNIHTVVLLFLRRDRNSKAYKLITQKRWFRKILCGYSLN